MVAQQSVGELFIGAVIPGLILSGMYIAFVSVYSWVYPEAGPALPMEERISIKQKIRLLKNMFAPIALVTLVLGIIFAGIATPVEAAGVGTFGAIVVASMHRRLNWGNVRAAAITTLRVTGMVLWIIFGATLFVGFYVINGGQAFVNETIIGTGLGPYGILVLMMVILVVLGMFLDWVGILLLAVPIFVPLMKTLSFDGLFGLPGVPPEELALWFGVVYMVNMQMSFLSPPSATHSSTSRAWRHPRSPWARSTARPCPSCASRQPGWPSASSFPIWCSGYRGRYMGKLRAASPLAPDDEMGDQRNNNQAPTVPDVLSSQLVGLGYNHGLFRLVVRAAASIHWIDGPLLPLARQRPARTLDAVQLPFPG